MATATNYPALSPSIDQFAQVLCEVPSWFNLGVYLGATVVELNAISKEHSDGTHDGTLRCLIELYRCLERKGKSLSWWTIISALKRMDNHGLAGKILTIFNEQLLSMQPHPHSALSNNTAQELQSAENFEISSSLASEYEMLLKQFILMLVNVRLAFHNAANLNLSIMQTMIKHQCGLPRLPQEVATINTVFDQVEEYCSILNFHVLEFLIENLLTDDPAALNLVKEFKAVVNRFKSSTDMVKLVTLIKNKQTTPTGDQKMVKLKVKEFWSKFTMEQFEIIANEIFLTLYEVMTHVTVTKGCICLDWIIPDIDTTKLLPMLPLELVKLIGVIYLHIGSDVIYNIEGEGCESIEAAMIQAFELKNTRAIELLLAVGCNPELATGINQQVVEPHRAVQPLINSAKQQKTLIVPQYHDEPTHITRSTADAELLDMLFLSIKDSFDSHTHLIRCVLEENRISLYDELKKHNLVHHLQDKDITYDNIRAQVLSCFELSGDVKELELHCQHFLTSLLMLNMPNAINLSRNLREEWNRKADSQSLGLSSFLIKETLPSEELDILKAAGVQPLESLLVDRQVERFQKQPDPQNKAALAIQQHYQEIVEIIAKNSGIAEKLLDGLCSKHLTRSAKKRALLQIANKRVQAKSIVSEVSVVITKGVVPKQHFGAFIAILDEQKELQSLFKDFIDKYKSDYVDQQNIAIHQQQSLEHHETANQNSSQQDDDSRAYLRERYHGLQGAFNQDKDWKFYDLSTPSGSLDLRCIPQKQKFSISRRTLITGGSGIGKSSICIELCKGWSRGELLTQYKYVILIEVREYPNLAINTVDDLFACVLEENNDESKIKSEITSDINETTYGANTLFIIDGYDELNRECREPNSFLGKWLQHKVVPRLHKASLVVTARPQCANEIKKYFPDPIEIQGLTQESRVLYLRDNLHHDVRVANNSTLLNEPIMERCTLNPFLLATLTEIINEDEEFKKKLPETFTMVYDALIRTSVLNFAEDSELEQFLQDDEEFAPGEFTSFPRNIYVPFLNLCALAYHRVNSIKKIPYTLQSNAIDFRLFNKVVRRTTAGRKATYTFLHPSIQEYLAAYCISRMKEKDKRECIEVLMKHIGHLSDQYSLILEFLHGFGCIKQEYVTDYEQYRAINTFSVIRQLCEVPRNSHEFIKSVYKELKNVQWMKKGIREDQVYCGISRTWPIPSPNDLWCLGKVIALSDCLWTMGLTFRPIQDVHLEMLCKGINSVHEPCTGRFQRIMLSLTLITDCGLGHFLDIDHGLSSIQELWLDSNNLTEKSVELLSGALPTKLNQLQRFLFHHNNIKQGCHKPLMDNLKDCRSLKHVSFTDLTPEECEVLLSQHQLKIIELWRISTPSCEALFHWLSSNKTLQDLEIYQSEVTLQCIEYLLITLPASNLKRLKLINCGIEDDCINPLIEALLKQAVESTSFESLDLCDNFITDESGKKLLELKIDLKETYLYNEFTQEMASKLRDNYEYYNDKREECGKHSSLYSRRRRVGLHKIE